MSICSHLERVTVREDEGTTKAPYPHFLTLCSCCLFIHMVSGDVEELAGHNASWYLDVANVVEQLAYG